MTENLSNDKSLALTINGKLFSGLIAEEKTLADFLHEDLNLTGTKICCGIGICRACTVVYKESLDGPMKRTQACITPVHSLNKMHVQTVEGIADKGELSPLQEAFLRHFSFQCGYSAPGFLMGATLLLDQLRRNPIKVDELENAIEEAVGEHVCRCTGYVKYHAAIREVILNSPELLRLS
ncbi:MAG: hypothetical protein KA436_00475 [Oligoflexales bacterium]|nr:hypothetical protein [Oligoflexales bacterium]